MELHIIESAGAFIVVETFSYKDRFFSKIHAEPFKTLDKAAEYVKVISEDALPANSIGGGNICKGAADMGVTPFLLRKEIKKRKKPVM